MLWVLPTPISHRFGLGLVENLGDRPLRRDASVRGDDMRGAPKKLMVYDGWWWFLMVYDGWWWLMMMMMMVPMDPEFWWLASHSESYWLRRKNPLLAMSLIVCTSISQSFYSFHFGFFQYHPWLALAFLLVNESMTPIFIGYIRIWSPWTIRWWGERRNMKELWVSAFPVKWGAKESLRVFESRDNYFPIWLSIVSV